MDDTASHHSTAPGSSTPLDDQPLLSPPPSPTTDMEPRAGSSENSSRVLELELRSHDVSLLPSTSNNSIAFWKAQIDQLSKTEREVFLQHGDGAGDLAEHVKRLEETCREQGGKSRAAKVARLFKPLFATMNMYAPIAQTMIQADPTSSALVLGGITCIMSISSRFLDHQDKIVSMLAVMGEKLEVLLKYSSDIYANNDEVLNSLMKIFGDILQFCSKAWNMYRDHDGKPRNSTKFLTTSLGKSFEMKFGDILSKFDKDLSAFNERALHCDRKNTKEFQKLQVRYMEYQVVETQKNSSALSEIRSIGQGVIEAVNRGQLEDGQNRMQRRIEGAQAKKEIEYKEREDKRQRILSWIPSIAFYKDQEDKSRELLKGTGQWLLDNDNFRLWRTSPYSELLWVLGKRGCGKSYLASQVIQEFSKACERTNTDDRDGQPVSAFAFIYCNSLESTKVDPSKLLGSILKQLCHQLPRPEIEPGLEQLYDGQSEVRLPHQTEIKDRIIAILGCFSQTFLVVDGLDECHELGGDQFEDLCQFVCSLILPRADDSVVKVVAFSRPEYAEIKSAFSGSRVIEIDAGLNNNDIKQFITMKLSGKGFHLKSSPELLAEVEGSLLSSADGMFLWVRLVVNALKGLRMPRDIRAAMHELPQDLDDVYENSLRKILGKGEKVRKVMLKTLLLITNAKRPLRRDELLEALVIDLGMKGLEQDDRILGGDGDADENFASDCADLIILDNNGYYQLLHSSLKDYLCSPSTATFNVPMEYRVMQTNVEKTLGEICLTYLTFDKFKTGAAGSDRELSKLLAENPFLDYASNYWGSHIAADKEAHLNDLMNRFLYCSGALNLSIQVFLLRHDQTFRECSGISTPLHALSIFNLLKIAKPMPEIHSMKTQLDGYGYLPLDYALHHQGREICDWLLENSENISIPEDFPAHGYPAIHAAVLNDWGQVVETLITLKYDPELTHGGRQGTPLHFAAKKGSESAFETLIKAKVTLNVRDIHNSTPLIDATVANHPKLAMRLLEEGAEVNLRDTNGYTALHWAAHNGDTFLAKALLQNGADKESAAVELGSGTPIYVAAKENRHEVLELLVADNVDIERKGPDDYTPLLISCARGSLKCVMSLLRAGAEIVAFTRSKGTVFHVAAANGHLDVLKTLYKNLPKESCDLINSADDIGDTALHDAVANDRKAEAKFLLEKGALVNKTNNLGQSPFWYAAFYGRADFISLLLEAEADPEQRDNLSWTPLHIATRGNKLEFVQMLLEVIPSLYLGARLEAGETSLFLAAREGLLDLVNFFLKQNEDPNVATRHGYTVLHAAAEAGNPAIVKKLLDAGCDGLHRSKRGITPYLSAILSRNVEVANLFLEKGINDCNYPDDIGFTPFHAIASNNNFEMLTKLEPFLDPASIKQANCVGQDAMFYAAGDGNAEMIDRLIALGIPPEGSKLAYERPIGYAAQRGYFDFVRRQIELGANVNECVGWSNRSPLHTATCYRMPLIVDILLKAGADPSERDAFGLSCLDYAIRDPKVWEKMGRWKTTYKPIDLSSRMPILRRTVQKTIQVILALPENSDPKDYFERLQNLNVLAWALVLMGTESDVYAAKMCGTELISPSEFALFAANWRCGICATKKKHDRCHEKWYCCTQCYAQNLCTSCYLAYLDGDEKPKSAPKSLRVLQELENEMKPIREIFKSLIHLGGRFVGDACGLLKVNAEWLNERVKRYEEWEKSYNDSGRFDDYQRPGQEFLKLIEKAKKAAQREEEEREEKEKGKWKGHIYKRERKMTREKGEDEANRNDTFAAITEEFSDLYAKHRPDREIPDFFCSDHEYLEILHQSVILETEKEYFGADGKLTNEWLSKLLENYQDPIIDGHADVKISKNKEGTVELENTPEQGSLGSAQESEGEDGQQIKVAEQEILGVSTLLQGQTEINHALGDTQGEASDHERQAGADSSNDIELNEKTIKLEVIKGMLKDRVFNMTRIICEIIRIERGAMEDEEHEISDKDFRSWILKQSDQKLDTGHDEQTPMLEHFLYFEVAWSLAQVIIVGFADQPLFEELWREIGETIEEVKDHAAEDISE